MAHSHSVVCAYAVSMCCEHVYIWFQLTMHTLLYCFFSYLRTLNIEYCFIATQKLIQNKTKQNNSILASNLNLMLSRVWCFTENKCFASVHRCKWRMWTEKVKRSKQRTVDKLFAMPVCCEVLLCWIQCVWWGVIIFYMLYNFVRKNWFFLDKIAISSNEKLICVVLKMENENEQNKANNKAQRLRDDCVWNSNTANAELASAVCRYNVHCLLENCIHRQRHGRAIAHIVRGPCIALCIIYWSRNCNSCLPSLLNWREIPATTTKAPAERWNFVLE